MSAHREPFPFATRPVAAAPRPVDIAQIEAGYSAKALEGVSRFDREARKAAKAQAHVQAIQQLAQAQQQAEAERAALQAHLDQQWTALLANDLETVMAVVGEALADNGAWAAPVGVDGEHVSIVMVLPPESELPDQKPHQAANGTWATKRLTAQERATLYLQMLASNALATAKETLAVAPGLTSATIAVIRNDAQLGPPDWKVLSVIETDRPRISQVDRHLDAPVTRLLDATADVEIRFRSNSSRILPLNPRQSGAAAAVPEKLEPDDEPDREQTADRSPAPVGPTPPPAQPSPIPAPTPTAAPIAPGWHPDPWAPGKGTLRYWDGSSWTPHTATRGTATGEGGI